MEALRLVDGKVSVTDVYIPRLSHEGNEKDVDSVIVKVLYAGICKTDLQIMQGLIKRPYNYTIGHEFCGDIVETDDPENWPIGMLVTANPMICGSSSHVDCMLGRDRDGCFARYVKVPTHALYSLSPELRCPVGAFIEPLAAAYGAYGKVYKSWLSNPNIGIKSNCNIGIFGRGRMANLLKYILKCHDFESIIIDPETLDTDSGLIVENNMFDCVIESSPEKINSIIPIVKPDGNVVLKSRHFKSVDFDINSAVMKDITLHGVRYSSFIDAVIFAECHIDDLAKTMKAYDFSDFRSAIDEAIKTDEKKIIMRMPCAE